METPLKQRCRQGSFFDAGDVLYCYFIKFIDEKKGIWKTGSFFCAHERRQKGGNPMKIRDRPGKDRNQ